MKFLAGVSLIVCLCCNVAHADERKPYVDAPWLSDRENQIYSGRYSTNGTWVYIDMKGLSFAEGDWGALHTFAFAINRYQQATRFLASWNTLMPEYQYFDRWVYDRNQEIVFRQSSPDGKTDWNGFALVEMVGVTDAMLTRAAQDKSNSVFDLLRFGATRRRIWWKGRWVVIPKSDPRVAARRNEFLNKEAEIEGERVSAPMPTKSQLQLDLKTAMKTKGKPDG